MALSFLGITREDSVSGMHLVLFIYLFFNFILFFNFT